MLRIGLRALSAAFAVSWLVLPGFGVIDLLVTWSSSWPQVLEAGWGLFFTVLVAAPFALVAARPRAAGPAIAQLAIAVMALAISAVAAGEARLGLFVAALVVETAIAGIAIHGRAGRRRYGLSRPLLLLGFVAAVPWLAYAWHIWALDRDDLSDSDVTVGIDHYSVQGALALALAVLPPFAAVRRDLRPFVPICAGVVAVYLGIVSAAWPDAAGGLGRTWSVAAIVWGVGLTASVVQRRPFAA